MPPESNDSLDSLQLALKAAPPVLVEYVRQLQSENLKLQREIAKLNVTQLTRANEVVALTEQVHALGRETVAEQLARRLKDGRERAFGKKDKVGNEEP